MASSCSWQSGIPIPEGVPPPAGDPVPAVDTYAKGRPADQLHEWAAARAPALDMSVTALEAYAYAARVAEVENPKCHLAWTTLGRHRDGGEPSRHLPGCDGRTRTVT